MLAYVFVHQPADDTDTETYVTRLRTFHQALALAPPEGFVRSWVWRVDDTPLGEAFEDWYLVKDWPGLGELNAAAVSGPRRAPHDGVAPLAGPGAGAVYALVHGTPSLRPARRFRLTKPPELDYTEFEGRLRLAAGPAVIWKRQMVLGADAEFLADSPIGQTRGAALGGRWVPLELVYPVRTGQ